MISSSRDSSNVRAGMVSFPSRPLVFRSVGDGDISGEHMDYSYCCMVPQICDVFTDIVDTWGRFRILLGEPSGGEFR